MYFVKYGDAYLHDPRIGLVLPEAKLEIEVNTSDIFTFTIPYDHDLYDILTERDQVNLVTVISDNEIIFRGEIIKINLDFYMTKSVECRGELSYLNDSIVRPYSTYEGESSRTAPSTVDGYFEFLIQEHNAQSTKTFDIGINEGYELDPNNYIYRADTTYPTVGSTLKDKILDSLGGYIKLTYNPDGSRTISLLKDFYHVNTQIIDFGVNLLDFVKDSDVTDVYSYVIPTGAYTNPANAEEIQEALTIESLDDGEIESGYFKYYDYIMSKKSVDKYGWIGVNASFPDIDNQENLLSYGLDYLKSLEEPSMTIEIKAVDLSMIYPEYETIRVGQYIRVRSEPHNYDGYMLLSKQEIDLIKVENDTFTLGTVQSTLTGETERTITALNSTFTRNVVDIQRDITEIKKNAGGDYTEIVSDIKALNDSVTAISTNLGNNYYTKTQTDSKLDSIIIGGRNYFTGSQEWSGSWINASKWVHNGYFEGMSVIEKESNTDWIYQQTTIQPGEYYTFSTYVKYSGVGVVKLVANSETEIFEKTITTGSEWARYSLTFKTISGTSISCRVEVNDGAKLSLCGYMLEKSTKPSDWTISPVDIQPACTPEELTLLEAALGI